MGDRGQLALRFLAAASSGALLLLVSPPQNVWWLHYLSWVPVLWSLRAGDHRRNILLGYCCGFVGEACVFHWIVEAVSLHSNIPFPIAILILGLYAAVFGLPFAVTFGSVHWLRERFGRAYVFLVPAVQVGMERIWPSLFPHYQGATQYRTLEVWQLASVLGVMGLTYLLFFCSVAIAELFYARRDGARRAWMPLAIFAGVFALNAAWGSQRLARVQQELASAPVLRVSFLQENTTMEQRMSEPAQKAFSSWVEITRKVEPLKPDLVVWPEGAFPGNPIQARDSELLGEIAREGNFDFLVGGGTYELNPPGSERRYTAYNSCYHYTPAGEQAGRYDKMRPLPFGEYLPLSDEFPFLKGLIEGIGDFRKGTVATVFHGRSYTFSAPICYEAILDGTMWKLSDVDLFVNITNDAWFGNTQAPHQHAMLAAVQAVQFGRPMLRIAYTGVCMIVEPDGSIPAETQPFTDVADVHELRQLSVDTGFRRGGWVFPWLCAGVSVAAFALGRRKIPLVTPSSPAT